MSKHRRPTRTVRTARRLVAIGATGSLALALGAGTAIAGTDDERCEDAHGVVVACTSDEVVDVDEIDLDVITHDHDHNGDDHDGWPFDYWELGP